MSLPIGFNYTPGSGLYAPLFSFETNSGGQYEEQMRLLLIGHKSAKAASSTQSNIAYPLGSQNDADQTFGTNSMLREMFRIANQNGALGVWGVAVPESGTQASWTLAVGAGATGQSGVGILRIAHEFLQIPISATDTAQTIASNIAAAINAYYNPLTQASLQLGTATAANGTVTVQALHAGTIFNDTMFYIVPSANNLFTGANLTITATPGTGVPSLAAALANLPDNAFYGRIVNPWSDNVSVGTVSQALSDVSGRWAYNRQSYGQAFTVYTGNIAAQTTYIQTAPNDRHQGHINRPASSVPHAAYLWAAGFAAAIQNWLADYTTGNVSRNQTGIIVQGLVAPYDKTLWPNYQTQNLLLANNISTWQANDDGSIAINKLVTWYSQGAGGQPDDEFKDDQRMFQVMHILHYLRFVLANACANKAIADTNPGQLAAIITPADIVAVLIGAYKQLNLNGLVDNVAGFANALNVQRDSLNPKRVNIMLGIEAINPLDIMAANAVFYSKLPQAA